MGGNKILLVFQSKRGSARQAAEWIAEALANCDVVDLGSRSHNANPAGYDTIIIGTGILAGSAYGQIKKFTKQHRETLLQKDLAIFITHIAPDKDGIEEDFTHAFDAEILAHASVRAGVGGRLQLKKLNFILRGMMRKIGEKQGIDFTNHDTLSREACHDFAERVLEGTSVI